MPTDVNVRLRQLPHHRHDQCHNQDCHCSSHFLAPFLCPAVLVSSFTPIGGTTRRTERAKSENLVTVTTDGDKEKFASHTGGPDGDGQIPPAGPGSRAGRPCLPPLEMHTPRIVGAVHVRTARPRAWRGLPPLNVGHKPNGFRGGAPDLPSPRFLACASAARPGRRGPRGQARRPLSPPQYALAVGRHGRTASSHEVWTSAVPSGWSLAACFVCQDVRSAWQPGATRSKGLGVGRIRRSTDGPCHSSGQPSAPRGRESWEPRREAKAFPQAPCPIALIPKKQVWPILADDLGLNDFPWD